MVLITMAYSVPQTPIPWHLVSVSRKTYRVVPEWVNDKGVSPSALPSVSAPDAGSGGKNLK